MLAQPGPKPRTQTIAGSAREAARPPAASPRVVGNQAMLRSLSRPAAGTPAAEATADAVRVTRQSGQPLASGLRAFFEPRFGRDFSEVRVHVGPDAADGARALQARAYTLGHSIVFGSGEYATATPDGRRLLAHELAHVVQQSGARGGERLRRFASAEHKSLGDQAAGGTLTNINIGTDATPDYLTFGDAVALAGDYFGSLGEMTSLGQTESGRTKLRWVYWWALGKDKGAKEPSLDDQSKQDIKDRYFTLASQNISHFSAGGTAGSSYKDQHTVALRTAFEEGTAAAMGGTQPDLTLARTQEAFAQHYLSDMFSGGHVRTERAAIKAWYDANMPQSISQFVAYMATKMHTYLVDKHGVADFFGQVPNEAELQQRIRTLGGKALAAFSLGDIVSLGYHNYDSQGLDVTSAADATGTIVPGGSAWRAMGDGMLGQSSQTRGMAVAAMRASLGELDVMAQKGATSPRVYADGGFANALAGLGDFAAMKYVPQAASTNHPLKWSWGFFNQRMYDAVDAAVKSDIVSNLRTQAAEQADANVRDALNDFAGLLEVLGIAALEQAVQQDARQKSAVLPGMYGYKAPGPDD